MTAMDIYRFIDSRDIREYLRETNYELDALQSAYIVSCSTERGFWEKQGTLREIIACLPDQEVPETEYCPGQPSLHDLLRDHLKWNSELTERLMSKEGDYIYQYDIGRDWGERSFPTRNFRKCFDKAHELCDTLGEDGFHVYKTYIDDPKKNLIRAYYDSKGSLKSICQIGMPDNGDPSDIKGPVMWPWLTREERRRKDYFDHYDPYIPVPFQRGDLVIDCKWRCDPFVWIDKDSQGRAIGYVVDEESGVMRKTVETETPYYIQLGYFK